MKIVIGAALAATALAALPAAAAAQGAVLEANGARAHGLWGGELGLGYRIEAGGFSLTPAIGAFIYQGDNDRYYIDEFENGQERCRDSDTGQFADDAKCNNLAAKIYGRVEAIYAIPMVAEIGGGVRISSDKVRPYGTVAVPLGTKLRLKGNAGDRYYALGLSFRL